MTNSNVPANGQPAQQPHNPYAQAEPVYEVDGAAAQGEKKEMPWYVEIPVVVVLTLLIMFLIQTFIGRLYVIPSASMEPTLHGENGSGDRIFVELSLIHI